MELLLSIKPTYSQKILSGEKKFEFRKRKPKQRVDQVLIYESSPSKAIVGSFTIKRIHSGTPEKIWAQCKNSGGIIEKKYFEYCNGSRIIYAYEIDEFVKFDNPINPFQDLIDFKPPQSFLYLKAQNKELMEKRLGAKSNNYFEPSLLEFDS